MKQGIHAQFPEMFDLSDYLLRGIVSHSDSSFQGPSCARPRPTGTP
jgi:hypothetical protein